MYISLIKDTSIVGVFIFSFCYIDDPLGRDNFNMNKYMDDDL